MSNTGNNHSPKFDVDDPRVSAYALGELAETERAQFLAAVEAAGPEAQAALDQSVAEVRQAAEVLSAALATEPSPALERSVDAEKASANVFEFKPVVAGPVFTSQPKERYMSNVAKMVLAASVLVCIVGLGALMVGSSSSPHGMFSNVDMALNSSSSPAMKSASGRSDPAKSAPRYYAEEAALEYDTARTAEPAADLERTTADQSYSGSATTTKKMAPAKVDIKRLDLSQPARPEPKLYAGDHPVQSPPAIAPPKSEPIVGGRPLEPEKVPAPNNNGDRDGDGRPDAEGGNGYTTITENDFLRVTQHPLSTFSIDVDTASYTIMRRYITTNHQLPPPSSVRLEEYLNYFTYDYAPPTDGALFAAHMEVAGCPWNNDHRLVRVALKGKEIAREQRPVSNLVFLLDVSGSMNTPDRLPRVIESMKMLVDQLGENDRVAIVVYAGASGLVLPSTSGEKKTDIFNALDKLQAGGSTAGGAGILLAYDVAVSNFIKGGTNRVILCTDGDFNVGISDKGQLQSLIEAKAKTGVFLSVFGFGMGNLKDDRLETLADKGNGTYGYIDSLNEAKKIFIEQMSGTLVTIAKDVKIQIEFNPGRVAGYRLLGYENRILAAQDFNDDKKDAGEIGAGHTVTALYEIVPAGKDLDVPGVDKLKYQDKGKKTEAADSEDLLTLKLRFKQPDADQSTLKEFTVTDAGKGFGQATADFKWATAVASYGMMLRNSKYAGNSTFGSIVEIAESAKGEDKSGYRAEFIDLVKKAKALRGQ